MHVENVFLQTALWFHTIFTVFEVLYIVLIIYVTCTSDIIYILHAVNVTYEITYCFYWV